MTTPNPPADTPHGSETPLTDALIGTFTLANGDKARFVSEEDCQNIERRLREAEERNEALETDRKSLNAMTTLLAQARRERDEAKARAEAAERRNEGMVYPAIHLVKVSPRHWEVRIEVGNKWVTVIEEVDGDGGNSHIVEPSGIFARIQAMLSAAEGGK